jgi:hypothetical protein
MKKLVEHTYGTHIYMKMELDNKSIEEIDVYIREDGERYKTSGDYNKELREEIIRTFKKLY